MREVLCWGRDGQTNQQQGNFWLCGGEKRAESRKTTLANLVPEQRLDECQQMRRVDTPQRARTHQHGSGGVLRNTDDGFDASYFLYSYLLLTGKGPAHGMTVPSIACRGLGCVTAPCPSTTPKEIANKAMLAALNYSIFYVELQLSADLYRYGL